MNDSLLTHGETKPVMHATLVNEITRIRLNITNKNTTAADMYIHQRRNFRLTPLPFSNKLLVEDSRGRVEMSKSPHYLCKCTLYFSLAWQCKLQTRSLQNTLIF